jgi:hypothetical protein
VLRCCFAVVCEGSIIRDCGKIGKMGVTCNVGIKDYSVSGEC